MPASIEIKILPFYPQSYYELFRKFCKFANSENVFQAIDFRKLPPIFLD